MSSRRRSLARQQTLRALKEKIEKEEQLQKAGNTQVATETPEHASYGSKGSGGEGAEVPIIQKVEGSEVQVMGSVRKADSADAAIPIAQLQESVGETKKLDTFEQPLDMLDQPLEKHFLKSAGSPERQDLSYGYSDDQIPADLLASHGSLKRKYTALELSYESLKRQLRMEVQEVEKVRAVNKQEAFAEVRITKQELQAEFQVQMEAKDNEWTARTEEYEKQMQEMLIGKLYEKQMQGMLIEHEKNIEYERSRHEETTMKLERARADQAAEIDHLQFIEAAAIERCKTELSSGFFHLEEAEVLHEKKIERDEDMQEKAIINSTGKANQQEHILEELTEAQKKVEKLLEVEITAAAMQQCDEEEPEAEKGVHLWPIEWLLRNGVSVARMRQEATRELADKDWELHRHRAAAIETSRQLRNSQLEQTELKSVMNATTAEVEAYQVEQAELERLVKTMNAEVEAYQVDQVDLKSLVKTMNAELEAYRGEHLSEICGVKQKYVESLQHAELASKVSEEEHHFAEACREELSYAESRAVMLNAALEDAEQAVGRGWAQCKSEINELKLDVRNYEAEAQAAMLSESTMQKKMDEEVKHNEGVLRVASLMAELQAQNGKMAKVESQLKSTQDLLARTENERQTLGSYKNSVLQTACKQSVLEQGDELSSACDEDLRETLSSEAYDEDLKQLQRLKEICRIPSVSSGDSRKDRGRPRQVSPVASKDRSVSPMVREGLKQCADLRQIFANSARELGKIRSDCGQTALLRSNNSVASRVASSSSVSPRPTSSRSSSPIRILRLMRSHCGHMAPPRSNNSGAPRVVSSSSVSPRLTSSHSSSPIRIHQPPVASKDVTVVSSSTSLMGSRQKLEVAVASSNPKGFTPSVLTREGGLELENAASQLFNLSLQTILTARSSNVLDTTVGRTASPVRVANPTQTASSTSSLRVATIPVRAASTSGCINWHAQRAVQPGNQAGSTLLKTQQSITNPLATLHQRAHSADHIRKSSDSSRRTLLCESSSTTRLDGLTPHDTPWNTSGVPTNSNLRASGRIASPHDLGASLTRLTQGGLRSLTNTQPPAP